MTGIVMNRYRYCPPLAASFATLIGTNSETPTVTDTVGSGMQIKFGTSPGGGQNVRCVLKAKPGSPTTYDIIARIDTTSLAFQYVGAGLCVSDGTKIVALGFEDGNSGQGAGQIQVVQWNSATSFNATLVLGQAQRIYEWLKISVVSGAVTSFHFSSDGLNWVELYSGSQSGFLTYTSIGFYQHYQESSGVYPVSGTPRLISGVLYYSDPDIVPAV